MIYTFTDLYSDTSDYKKGRKKGSRNKRRKITTSEPQLSEEEKYRRVRATRQNIDTGLRGSREIRSWVSLARAFA